MDSRRGVFVAGIVLGCALGFVSGHTTIWGRSSLPEPFLVVDSQTDFSPTIRVAEAPPQLFPTDLSTDYTISEIGSRSSIQGTADAVALRHGESERPTELTDVRPLSIPPDEPQPIPVKEAAPLVDTAPARSPKPAANESYFRELRKLVDSELSEYPQAQRDVWFESLKEFSPDHVPGVLQMWKRFGAPATIPLGTPPTTVGPTQPTPSPGKEPDLVLPPGISPKPTDVAHGLSTARALHLRNLAHVQTVGYKRLIPMPVEHSDQGIPTFADCDARVDLSTGLRHDTEMPLDWMISGNAFFVIQGEDSRLYTKNGHFTLDANRRICLQEGTRLHPVVPELQLPENTVSIHLDGNGLLTVSTMNEKDVRVGQLEIAQFANPAGLEPAGNAFFWETTGSGPARLQTPEHSGAQIRQGALELSNVKPDQEWMAIDMLENLLER